MMKLLHKINYYSEPYGTDKYAIVLEDGKFAGTKFVFGRVSFDDTGDNCTLKYDYDIIESNNPINQEDVTSFETLLGDLLMQMIQEGVAKNDIVYTGGTDAN